MTSGIGFALLLGLALVAGPAAPAAARPVFNPQAGLTSSSYSFDEGADFDYESGQVGYAFGGTARFGGKLYVAPGLYYQRTGFEATVGVPVEMATDVVDIDAIHVPVSVGYILSKDATAASSPGLRVYAGPALTFVTSVAENNLGVDKDDFVSTIVGGVIGAGFDLTKVTFDLSYEIGISEILAEGDQLRQNVLRGLVGYKF